MAYVDTLLAGNEKILARHHQHWLAWIPALAGSLLLSAVIVVGSVLLNVQLPGIGLFGLILLVLPLVTFVNRLLNWLSEEYIITNRRILQTKGVLTKQVFDSSLEKINDVMLSQTLLGRMFNYGDLEIMTGSELGINKLSRITRPVQFKVAMMNAKEGMRDG
jgi:uncharacterized membrane protein YdbT with pleckstrin-like domain